MFQHIKISIQQFLRSNVSAHAVVMSVIFFNGMRRKAQKNTTFASN